MARRSPVRLVCTRPFVDVGDDMRICRWMFPRGGATVQFRHRTRKDWYAIIHPSTKQKGKWQVSSFDYEGAIGDVIRATPEQALYDAGVDRNWKIEKVDPRALAGLRR